MNIKHFSYTDLPSDIYDREVLGQYAALSVPTRQNGVIDSDVYKFEGVELFHRRNKYFDSVIEAESPTNKWVIEIPLNISTYIAQPDGSESNSMLTRPGDHSVWHQHDNETKTVLSIEKSIFYSLVSIVDRNILMEDGRRLKRRELTKTSITQLSFLANTIKNSLSGNLLTSRNDLLDLITQYYALVTEQMARIHTSHVIEHNYAREQMIARALDFIHSAYDKKITPSQVADVCNTSLRNLQKAFQSKLELTPNQYIKRYRLFLFHQNLAKSRSVTEAALNSGFYHLGRASIEYQQLFGKMPSQELAFQLAKVHKW